MSNPTQPEHDADSPQQGGVQVSVQALLDRYRDDLARANDRAIRAEVAMEALQAELAEAHAAVAQVVTGQGERVTETNPTGG